MRRQGGGKERGREGRSLTCIVVTLAVSHKLMSLLKVAHAGLPPQLAAPEYEAKRYDISVIRDTSHVPIAPYVPAAAVGLVHHASRAVFSAALEANTCALCSSRRAVGERACFDAASTL